MSNKKGALGKEGEERAVQLLHGKGYQILEQNYRYRKAEIDIIARQETTLVIVEVKSRSSTQFQELTETISKKQIKNLIEAADFYVNQLEEELEVRFDFITVLAEGTHYTLTHYEDAFNSL